MLMHTKPESLVFYFWEREKIGTKRVSLEEDHPELVGFCPHQNILNTDNNTLTMLKTIDAHTYPCYRVPLGRR